MDASVKLCGTWHTDVPYPPRPTYPHPTAHEVLRNMGGGGRFNAN